MSNDGYRIRPAKDSLSLIILFFQQHFIINICPSSTILKCRCYVHQSYIFPVEGVATIK